jgi:hypothetical protein
MSQPTCNRIKNTEYRIDGVIGDYLEAITEQWIKPAPDANPAMLEMFRDRDRLPLRSMVPWAGEFAGKYLTHSVQIYRLTHDAELGAQIKRFVDELISLQADDGYLGPWPKGYELTGTAPNGDRPTDETNTEGWRWDKWNGLPWANYRIDPAKGKPTRTWDTWGHYHAMVGLLLWHRTSGDRKPLLAARRIGDLMCRMFLDSDRRMADTESTEMNLAPAHSLAMLHSLTKEKRYLDLALKIVDEFAVTDVGGEPDNPAGNYLNCGLANEPFHKTPKPRWESLHPIMALAELYWIAGKNDYRNAFENLWWSMLETDRHNNGGFTSGERAQGNPYHRGPIETCCTVAWTAMSVEMLKLTGKSVVADEIELSTLNSGLGLISQSGRWVTYNTPMDGVRLASGHHISFQAREGSPELNCCSVNGPRGLGMIGDWATMRGADGAVIVNYYGPSRIATELGNGIKLTVTQETDYPRSGRIEMKISPSKAIAIPLKLRIPYWSHRTKVSLNGKRVGRVEPGKYFVLDRRWRRGDRIRIDLDMSLHYWVGELECAGKVSIYRGPILLTFDRRFNDVDLNDVPTLNADGLKGKLVSASRYRPAPWLLIQFPAEGGKSLRLCDFASAGEAGSPYLSWLEVRGVEGVGFTRDNPLRSSRKMV